MTLTDNRRLMNIAGRLQLYVEGVKVQYSQEFNFVLYKLNERIGTLLNRVKYSTLDGLSKAELNALIVTLRDTQSRVYNQYIDGLIRQLRDFMKADLKVNRSVWATVYKAGLDGKDGEQPNDTKPLSDDDAIAVLNEANKRNSFVPLFGIAAATSHDDRMWAAITNSPIPANGLYLLPFLKGFSSSAQSSVENIIRKAWANGSSVADVIAEITGTTAKQGVSSNAQRIIRQAQAVIATATQHVSAMSSAAVVSTLYGKYQWHSVLDSGTTDICRSRNGNIYSYGKGPQPPAHIGCRSTTSPYVEGGGDEETPTFYSWMKAQPSNIQDDALGAVNASKLRNGGIKAADINKYESPQPLTLKDFVKKIVSILTR